MYNSWSPWKHLNNKYEQVQKSMMKQKIILKLFQDKYYLFTLIKVIGAAEIIGTN